MNESVRGFLSGGDNGMALGDAAQEGIDVGCFDDFKYLSEALSCKRLTVVAVS